MAAEAGSSATATTTFQEEYGELSEMLKGQPEWIKLGCGDAEYMCAEKGPTFDTMHTGALPDLSGHHNLCAEYLREHPDVWEALKGRKTSHGVTLAKCIKTGMDNKGHPHIKTVGLVAGDEECFTVFRELFDPVCSARHNHRDMSERHQSDMDVSKLSKRAIDPTGRYCLTTRCRTGRSIHGYPLPPSCSFQDRRAIEKAIVSGLLELDGELDGDYYGLHGSKSTATWGPDLLGEAASKMMDTAKEEELRSNGNLFQEPDSTLLLSSGCGRHWPDARGIFHNRALNFFVWINEEDHCRIISMQKGADIRAIFARFAQATAKITEVLGRLRNAAGEQLSCMHSDTHGYILTCPSNLGTGLRAGTMVRVPCFSARPTFKTDLAHMHLQARGTAGVDSASVGGVFDISNADRLGYSEVILCNLFIEGVARIIEWEQALEKHLPIDPLIETYISVDLPKLLSGEPLSS
jgi:ATP:guanido phosphotransferase, C-terminal catalytic domain/ATP:guanido phosphotransferase, N-terminal domain